MEIMNEKGKEIKEEWEKHLSRHIQSANRTIAELVKEYLDYKKAEEQEPVSNRNDHKYLYKQLKQERAVEIVELLLNEKELAEKIRL
jgi:predicted transcriptional regulator